MRCIALVRRQTLLTQQDRHHQDKHTFRCVRLRIQYAVTVAPCRMVPTFGDILELDSMQNPNSLTPCSHTPRLSVSFLLGRHVSRSYRQRKEGQLLLLRLLRGVQVHA